MSKTFLGIDLNNINSGQTVIYNNNDTWISATTLIGVNINNPQENQGVFYSAGTWINKDNTFGSDTQILFNSGGTVSGSSYLTWNNSILTTPNLTTTGLTVKSLTNQHVLYSNSSNQVVGSSNMVFNGTCLILNENAPVASERLRVNGDTYLAGGTNNFGNIQMGNASTISFYNNWGIDKIIFRADVPQKITSDLSGNYDWFLSTRNMSFSDVTCFGIGTTGGTARLNIKTISILSSDTALSITDNINNNLFIIDSTGNTQLSLTSAIYFGDKNTDGSWRFIVSGNDFVVQKRESGNYITKGTFNA